MIGFLVSFSFEREAPRHGFHWAGRLAGSGVECLRNVHRNALLPRTLRTASEYENQYGEAYRKSVAACVGGIRAESELLYPAAEAKDGIFYQEKSLLAEADRAYLF